MKLTGDLRKIGTKRDSKFQDISLQIKKVEYLTYKKDGHYFQAFDYEVELEEPVIITGDRLARKNLKLPEGELHFEVYDKQGGEYVLNENVKLEVELEYDFEEDVLLLTSVYYAVTLAPKDFEFLKKELEKEKAFRNRKGNKKR